jgi:hypothetical protein
VSPWSSDLSDDVVAATSEVVGSTFLRRSMSISAGAFVDMVSSASGAADLKGQP